MKKQFFILTMSFLSVLVCNMHAYIPAYKNTVHDIQVGKKHGDIVVSIVTDQKPIAFLQPAYAHDVHAPYILPRTDAHALQYIKAMVQARQLGAHIQIKPDISSHGIQVMYRPDQHDACMKKYIDYANNTVYFSMPA